MMAIVGINSINNLYNRSPVDTSFFLFKKKGKLSISNQYNK